MAFGDRQARGPRPLQALGAPRPASFRFLGGGSISGQDIPVKVIAGIGTRVRARRIEPTGATDIPSCSGDNLSVVIAGLDPEIHSIEISIGYGSGMDARLVGRA
jgi:hypothetical protein